ncbi:DUF2397 family protein [Natribacillus halophilus]|uniref:Uncharacterized protein n=1 Tax=Natribacillus halophilus TaxID=549003 RepID=A0A1G8LDB2_9BACI|nr:DUF2397 family protein [Natribacillus halophilus]SDI53603.1 Protein of unknown function [Natribacillus halophilus]
MQDSVKKRVKEATYLAAEKASSYRVILRYCYIQHERMRQFLFAEEIHAHLQEDATFAEYSLEELQRWKRSAPGSRPPKFWKRAEKLHFSSQRA